ncbi:hypothetical protein ACFY93_29665 [Streptomyces sp. NPDC008313]|uniref:hypothetical protein n=1 Tax=Streptomyces sp. NPDC008313 TaxID=3364826 RepID=UPI0036F0871D
MTNISRRALQSAESMAGVGMHAVASHRLAIEHWLLSAHRTAGQARHEWAVHGIALLPLGGTFSAVRIPGRLVQALAGGTDPEDIDAVLDETLEGGPVICDAHGPRYYALVPAAVPRTWHQATDDWRVHDVDCLGRGAYLGVPRLDFVQYTIGAASYWSVPPTAPAALCGPLAVARLIAAGVHQLTEDRDPWPLNAPLSPRA